MPLSPDGSGTSICDGHEAPSALPGKSLGSYWMKIDDSGLVLSIMGLHSAKYILLNSMGNLSLH